MPAFLIRFVEPTSPVNYVAADYNSRTTDKADAAEWSDRDSASKFAMRSAITDPLQVIEK